MSLFKIGIIGFGNIGKKRFNSITKIEKFNNIKIKVECISDKNKNNEIPKHIKYVDNWKNLEEMNLDLIIVSTPTSISEKIAMKFSGKFNLLVEKPITTNLNSLKKITQTATKNQKILKTGYNLRFDDGLLVAKKIFDEKKLGNIYYSKIIYANGAARTNSNNVGSLMDMASHSINLIQWFFKKNKLKNKYYINQKNEYLSKKKIDNGYIVFQADKSIIFLHHGFCSWKNHFEFEIVGSKGYLKISSLSKWGNQKVIYGKRIFPSGPPINKTWHFKSDNSWKNELTSIIKDIIKPNKNIASTNIEGYNTLNILKKIKDNV